MQVTVILKGIYWLWSRSSRDRLPKRLLTLQRSKTCLIISCTWTERSLQCLYDPTVSSEKVQSRLKSPASLWSRFRGKKNKRTKQMSLFSSSDADFLSPLLSNHTLNFTSPRFLRWASKDWAPSQVEERVSTSCWVFYQARIGFPSKELQIVQIKYSF